MKTGRNAPCPCGSGKKYKKCCLKLEEQRAAEERQQNANEQKLFLTGESVLSDNEDHEGGPDEDDEGDDDIEKSESDRIWDEYKDGDLDLLLSAMHKGWEKVKDSSKIVPWGVDEYDNLAAEYAILKHVSEVSNPDATDSDFLKELEQFIEAVFD